MKVIDIIKAYLKDNGFDGLSGPDECGCSLDDLCSCEEDPCDCRAAHKFKCKVDCKQFDECSGKIGDDCFRVYE